MRIDASRPASDFIRKKGGDLFVWFGDAGGDLLEHVSTKKPQGPLFERHDAPDGFRVWLEVLEGSAPDEIRLRRRPWPLGPIEVTWVGGPGPELDEVNRTYRGH